MEFEDNKVREIVKNSKLEIPFSDFEDNMMGRIFAYEAKKKEALKNRFYSLLSFFLGTIFGLALNYILSQNLGWLTSSQLFQERIGMGINVVYIILFILFSDKFWKLYKTRRFN